MLDAASAAPISEVAKLNQRVTDLFQYVRDLKESLMDRVYTLEKLVLFVDVDALSKPVKDAKAPVPPRATLSAPVFFAIPDDVIPCAIQQDYDIESVAASAPRRQWHAECTIGRRCR